MLNVKRLLEMAKKWQKVAASRRRRITSMRSDQNCSTPVACRGHMFVYSADGKRFMIPLTYLSSTIFRKLFRMSEEEFGLQSDGPITLPFDSSCMEYVLSLIPFKMSIDVERSVLTAISSSRCTGSRLPLRHERQNQVLCGF